MTNIISFVFGKRQIERVTGRPISDEEWARLLDDDDLMAEVEGDFVNVILDRLAEANDTDINDDGGRISDDVER